MDFLQPIYIAFIGFSFLVSLTVFRYGGPPYLKTFSVLLGLTITTELLAVYGHKYLFHGISNATYNIFMPIEFCLYAIFYRIVLKNKNTLTTILIIIILLTWSGSTFFLFGLHKWNSYISIVGCCCAIILAVCYYIQQLASPKFTSLARQPVFFIATGMLVFYSCQLPFLGTLNYLVKNHLSLAKDLLAVLRILNIVMYSLFTYAYICHLIQRKSSLS
jgi:hypothetical protein